MADLTRRTTRDLLFIRYSAELNPDDYSMLISSGELQRRLQPEAIDRGANCAMFKINHDAPKPRFS
jgi:hypothetical protein